MHSGTDEFRQILMNFIIIYTLFHLVVEVKNVKGSLHNAFVCKDTN